MPAPFIREKEGEIPRLCGNSSVALMRVVVVVAAMAGAVVLLTLIAIGVGGLVE